MSSDRAGDADRDQAILAGRGPRGALHCCWWQRRMGARTAHTFIAFDFRVASVTVLGIHVHAKVFLVGVAVVVRVALADA